MATKPSEILRRAKARIEKPENWCQGSYAQPALGESRLHRFCAKGALYRETCWAEGHDYGPSHQALNLLDQASWKTFRRSPIGVNDAFGHEAVLQIYDVAIKQAEANEEQLNASQDIRDSETS
jgi:hypothetical protein